MTEQIPYPFPTALDIRADYALAKVYRTFQLGDYHSMIGRALTAASTFAYETLGPYSDGTIAPTCPLMFVDEPELVSAWGAGAVEAADHLANMEEEQRVCEAEEEAERQAEARRVDYLAWLQAYPFPTGAELLARLLAGESEELNGHSLNYDEGEGVWVTNSYGVDCLLISPTAQACQSFIDGIRAGREFGPTPN